MPGFFAEGKRGADLDASGAQEEGLGEFAGMAVTAGEPKGQAERADFVQLGDVARAVEGLAFAESTEAGREAGHCGRRRWGLRRRNRPLVRWPFWQGSWPRWRRRRCRERGGASAGGAEVPQKCCGSKVMVCLFTGQGAFDINVQGGGLALSEQVKNAGDGPRDACAHEDVVNAREHRAVKGGQRGELDFFEIVDTHRALMPFLGRERPRRSWQRPLVRPTRGGGGAWAWG